MLFDAEWRIDRLPPSRQELAAAQQQKNTRPTKDKHAGANWKLPWKLLAKRPATFKAAGGKFGGSSSRSRSKAGEQRRVLGVPLASLAVATAVGLPLLIQHVIRRWDVCENLRGRALLHLYTKLKWCTGMQRPVQRLQPVNSHRSDVGLRLTSQGIVRQAAAAGCNATGPQRRSDQLAAHGASESCDAGQICERCLVRHFSCDVVLFPACSMLSLLGTCVAPRKGRYLHCMCGRLGDDSLVICSRTNHASSRTGWGACGAGQQRLGGDADRPHGTDD